MAISTCNVTLGILKESVVLTCLPHTQRRLARTPLLRLHRVLLDVVSLLSVEKEKPAAAHGAYLEYAFHGNAVV